MTLVETIQQLLQSINPIINSFVAALVIVFIGFIFGKLAGSFARRVAKDTQKTGKNILRMDWSKEVSLLVSYTIYLMTLLLALNELGVTKAVLITLLAIILLVTGLSALMLLKDFVPNLRAGLIIRRQCTKGSHVRIGKISGTVTGLFITEVSLLRDNDELFLVPNTVFLKATKNRNI